MDKLWKHYTKWKKSGTKDHILCHLHEIPRVSKKKERTCGQSVQFIWSSHVCNPVDCSTPGFPVHHQLLELAQTHVHWVSDAILLSHPLPFPVFNLSQHQGLFQWVSSFYWSFSFSISPSMNIQDWFLLEFTGWISCCSRDSQESSPTPQFKSINY